MEFDKEININHWQKSIKNFNTTSSLDNKHYDYYVVINWAKFTHEMNKKSFDWYRVLRKNIPTKI